MKIYIGDKVVNLDKRRCKRLDNKLTATSDVYRYGSEVIKLFKGVEDEIFYRYFVDCNLELKVISVPYNLVYDDSSKFIGNVSIYRDGIVNFNDYWRLITNFNKKQFMDNVYALQDDLDVLSEHEIIAKDLRTGNCIFNEGILYHVDYGFFNKCINSEDKDYDEFIGDIKIINQNMLNEFLKELMMRLYVRNGLALASPMFYSKNRIELFENNMKENETVKEFIKRY